MRLSSLYIPLILTVSFFLVGCSPTYVIRAAYEQGKILLARDSIQDIVRDEKVDPKLKEKLQLALDAREFATAMGLNVGGAFLDYVDVKKDVLTWVVVGAREDSFELYTYWFPIVGRVPYKGFFEREDAQAEKLYLESKGYEAFIRGAETFSTLGWFDDPLFSTTIRRTPIHIVNTIIHESVHSTLWIKGSVSFNESLANFVATEATVEFFQNYSDGVLLPESRQKLQEQAKRSAGYQYEFASMVGELYTKLSDLYSRRELPFEQKLAQRNAIFSVIVPRFKEQYPFMTALTEINNAEIVQYALYVKDLELFRKLYDRCGRSWEIFFDTIHKLSVSLDDGETKDPFSLLRQVVESSQCDVNT